MTPASLVNHGEDLEVNLIDAPGEMDVQGRTVMSGDDPGHEATR